MRILIVHNEYKFPGGEDVVVEQEEALLRQAGNQVALYRRNNRELDQQSSLQRLGRLPSAVWAWDAKAEISRILKEFNPEVVHVHNTLTMISPAVFWACHEAGIPAVMTLHNFRLYCPAGTFFRDGHVCEDCPQQSLWQGVKHGCYRDSRAATAAAALTLAVHRRLGTWMRAVEFYIAFHDFARRKMTEVGLPAEKILVKPNFVSPDPGQGAGNGGYALYVGRLTVDKGIPVLLAAWKRLNGRIPLMIAGEGPLQDLVAEAAQSIPGITYRGRLPRAETLRAMKEARFLLFPSVWYEGFPVTIAESLACGVPVVASRMGAMEGLISDGQTGLHFVPGSGDDLAERALWLWEHPEKSREMGSAARAEYLAEYTAEKNYPVLMDIYRRAIDQKQSSEKMGAIR